jgi:hypothetical protein
VGDTYEEEVTYSDRVGDSGIVVLEPYKAAAAAAAAAGEDHTVPFNDILLHMPAHRLGHSLLQP